MRRKTVKKHVSQYLNEIVSIAIMLLMAIALIAGQLSPVSAGTDRAADRVPYRSVTVTGDE